MKNTVMIILLCCCLVSCASVRVVSHDQANYPSFVSPSIVAVERGAAVYESQDIWQVRHIYLRFDASSYNHLSTVIGDNKSEAIYYGISKALYSALQSILSRSPELGTVYASGLPIRVVNEAEKKIIVMVNYSVKVHKDNYWLWDVEIKSTKRSALLFSDEALLDQLLMNLPSLRMVGYNSGFKFRMRQGEIDVTAKGSIVIRITKAPNESITIGGIAAKADSKGLLVISGNPNLSTLSDGFILLESDIGVIKVVQKDGRWGFFITGKDKDEFIEIESLN